MNLGNNNWKTHRGRPNTSLLANTSYRGLEVHEEDTPEIRVEKMTRFLYGFLKQYRTTDDTESYDLFASYLAVSIYSFLKDRDDFDDFIRDVGRFEPSEPAEYLGSFYEAYLKNTLRKIYKTGKDRLGRPVSPRKMSGYDSLVDKLYLEFIEAKEWVEGVVEPVAVANATMAASSASSASASAAASGNANSVAAVNGDEELGELLGLFRKVGI